MITIKAIPVLSPSRLPTAFALSSSASSAPSASAGSRRTRARPSRLGGSRGQGGIQRAAGPVNVQWAHQMGNRYTVDTRSMSESVIARLEEKTYLFLYLTSKGGAPLGISLVRLLPFTSPFVPLVVVCPGKELYSRFMFIEWFMMLPLVIVRMGLVLDRPCLSSSVVEKLCCGCWLL